MELKICHLYPDMLNLYGDNGNITCMKQRLAWRAIDAIVTEVPMGAPMTDDFDLLFIGGGLDFEQGMPLTDLQEKAEAIKKAIEDEKTVLAICAGYQLLGESYTTAKGERIALTGVLPFETVGEKKRLTGDFVFTCEELGGEAVVAFENHAGRTRLTGELNALGTVLVGNGNNGQDGTEGLRYKNVFASYGHGCLLGKNPKLCDLILLTALRQKYGEDAELAPLDDALENMAHDAMVKRITK